MQTTALASVTRLPTAAPRKVRNPDPIRCASLVCQHGIVRLPNKAQRLQAEQDEALGELDEFIADSPERLLIFALLRCIPAWQARNVAKITGRGGQGETPLLARVIAAYAARSSIGGEGAR